MKYAHTIDRMDDNMATAAYLKNVFISIQPYVCLFQDISLI